MNNAGVTRRDFVKTVAATVISVGLAGRANADVAHPVLVGGSPEKRGVVAAANYIARRYGVHSAMPAVTARRLCPAGIFLPPRISYDAEISSQIQEIFGRFTSLVEPLSLDEAFLDPLPVERLWGVGSSEEGGGVASGAGLPRRREYVSLNPGTHRHFASQAIRGASTRGL
jgi:nucleotidyltransferase/DNA polymerase involved in DNA repair